MSAIPYHVEFDAEDEDGQPERWKFVCRRPTRRGMVLLDELVASEGLDGTNKFVDNIGQFVRRIELNGEVQDVEDVPMEVLQRVFDVHPTFRQPDRTD